MAILLLGDTLDEDDPPDVVLPDVVSNWIWRRVVGDPGDGIRIASIEADGSFIDWATASGVAYEYRAQAVAANGTSTYGPWTT